MSAPCKDCGRRPKMPGRHRCVTCYLRSAPIGEQVEASRRRLAMVPEDMRKKHTLEIIRLAPRGTDWCAGCQSFRDLVDFGNTAKVTHTQCRACRSAKAHEAMVAKTYGLTGDDYAALLERQGGKCAICRARPKSKRLAVDHDHKTGAVRGLLCSRCNHDLLGSAWDSLAIASALWHYMNTPPAAGAWVPPEAQSALTPIESATRPPDDFAVIGRGNAEKPRGGGSGPDDGECTRLHVIPVGAERVPGKRGVWRMWSEPNGEAPF